MNQTIFIRQTIYDLKQNYGVKLQLYTIVDSTVNLETGRKAVQKKVYTIRKAILLPRTTSRDFSYDLSFIAANKNFTYGGLFDKTSRTLVIDMRDYPKDYIVKPTDYALIEHERYNVKEVTFFDHKLAAVLTVEQISGEQPAAIIEMKVNDNLLVNSGSSACRDVTESISNGLTLTDNVESEL